MDFNYFPCFYTRKVGNYFPRIETQKLITLRVFDAGSKTEFTNNSMKSPKIGKLNIDTLITPQGLLIHEKTQTQNSHANVPLLYRYIQGIALPDYTWVKSGMAG